MGKTRDLFKKIRYTKGIFHAKIGTIQNRNCIDLTEAEGEGNGNPLQYSCLENPRDGGAWWAAVYGVTESDMTEATQQQQMQKIVRRGDKNTQKEYIKKNFMTQITTMLCSLTLSVMQSQVGLRVTMKKS